MEHQKNSMSRLVEKVNTLPKGLRYFILTRLFGRLVPFLRTAGLHFDEVTPQRLVVSIVNQRKVQNHIRGVHATAMALLAETATGFIVGMNIPDDKLMLLKSMKIDYLKRAQGNMCAVATLSTEQIQSMYENERGSVVVAVTVTDEMENSPIQCEMIWAWVPKKHAKK